MIYHADITAALDGRLATMTGLPDVAWPNYSYTPTTGTTYLRVAILPATRATSTLDNQEQPAGVYQVTVCAEAGTAKSAAEAMADAVAEHMRRQTLATGTATVRTRAASVGPAVVDGAWYLIPVSVDYDCEPG